ncbi:hypothetical protein V1478_007221 [Vespula squamosa]|uniref:Uncharacterized protein n=1 Tax=Vespula squamosa TaxID=30214 RepID=A0ABD2B2J5_VESSQ
MNEEMYKIEFFKQIYKNSIIYPKEKNKKKKINEKIAHIELTFYSSLKNRTYHRDSREQVDTRDQFLPLYFFLHLFSSYYFSTHINEYKRIFHFTIKWRRIDAMTASLTDVFALPIDYFRSQTTKGRHIHICIYIHIGGSVFSRSSQNG